MHAVDSVNKEYIELRSQRFKDLFHSFLVHTNQKKQSAEILKNIIDVLLGVKDDCKIFDVGVGEGSLAKNIAQVLKTNCANISYNGIELIGDYVIQANNILQSLNISSVNIQEGDFSTKSDYVGMPNDADVILASHVAYYAKNVTELVANIIDKAGSNTRLLFFHQSIFSKTSELREMYKLDDIQASPQLEIKNALKYFGFDVIELYYPAVIYFPTDISIQSVINAFLLGQSLSSEMQTVRNLLEFMFNVPFEYLRDINKLQYCGEIVAQILQVQRQYILWDVLQIATRYKSNNVEVPSTPMCREDLPSDDSLTITKKIYIEDFVHIDKKFWKYSPLEIACYTGNIGIMRNLKSQIANQASFIGLILAAEYGHIDIVKELLQMKEVFNLNIAVDGYTALHAAAYNNHPYIIKLLLLAGIDKHATDKYGNTAFDLSVQHCRIEAIEVLWKYTGEELETKKIYSLINSMKRACEKTPDAVRIEYVYNGLAQIINSKFEICFKAIKAKGDQLISAGIPALDRVLELNLVLESRECDGFGQLEQSRKYHKTYLETYHNDDTAMLPGDQIKDHDINIL